MGLEDRDVCLSQYFYRTLWCGDNQISAERLWQTDMGSFACSDGGGKQTSVGGEYADGISFFRTADVDPVGSRMCGKGHIAIRIKGDADYAAGINPDHHPHPEALKLRVKAVDGGPFAGFGFRVLW